MGNVGQTPWRVAFDEAYATHKNRLLTLATAFTGNRHSAEDIVHDVFATLLKETEKLGNGLDVGAFLSVCVRNRAVDLLRRNTRRDKRERDRGAAALSPAPDPGRRTAQAEEEERLLQQVSRLPDDLKEVLGLRIWAEWTFEEIARLQQVTKSTAHARFNQALGRLRREFPGEMHDE